MSNYFLKSLEKVRIYDYTVTIEKFFEPELKYTLYRKYKSLANPPEGIWINIGASKPVSFNFINKDGSLSPFEINKKMFKMCGVTAEDVDLKLKLTGPRDIKTPSLVTREWWHTESRINTIDSIELVNSSLLVKNDNKLVWAIRDLGHTGTIRVLSELLKLVKGYLDAAMAIELSDNLKKLLIKVKPVSIAQLISPSMPMSQPNGGN